MDFIDYIITFLLGRKNEGLRQYVSYGESESSLVIIVPSPFFDAGIYMTKKSLPEEPLKAMNEIPIFFGTDKIEHKEGKTYLYADIIASTFFLITRYEECVCRERDQHGRFTAEKSILSRQNILNRCIVDEYGKLLRTLLREYGLKVEENRPEIKKIYLTHDIDSIRMWESFYRASRSVVRRILDRRTRPLRPYAALLNYKKNDPIYTFPFMVHTDTTFIKKTKIPCEVIYFLMGTRQKTEHDNGYAKDVKTTQELVDFLKSSSQIGYHVSYEAKEHLELQAGEIRAVAKYSGRKVTSSRNHYLASKEPEDYRVLLKNGITDDFTMGYPDCIGFRLGTCRPVRWIDPYSMKVTDLTLHPLTVMERTLDSYMRIRSEDAAFERIKGMIETIRNFNGDVVLLWHNTSFSGESDSYYKSLYLRLLHYLSVLPENRGTETT